jgi:hypothetical protein
LGDGRIDLYEALRTLAPQVSSGPPPDTAAPTVAVTSPAANAAVRGVYPLAVTASDNVGVVSVQFKLDGVTLGDMTSTPFDLNWDSTTTSAGAHVLVALARDAAGNVAESSVSFTVANDMTAPTVTVTTPTDGATVSGSIALGASASDNVGVAGVQFTVDGVNVGAEHTSAPYAITWNSASVANGPHVIAAVARDAAGNQQTSSVTVVVANLP